MSKIEDDTVGGFNSFLSDHRGEEGPTTVSLYEFDTNVSRKYNFRVVGEAPELGDDNYTPSGRTALHDTIVTAIDETAEHIGKMAASTRPENVVVVVLTDGKENASETPQKTVRERVEEVHETGWEFLSVGANQDAALTAGKMGIDEDRSLSMAHSGEGTRAAYESTSQRIQEVRDTGTTDGYEQTDRTRQEDAKED